MSKLSDATKPRDTSKMTQITPTAAAGQPVLNATADPEFNALSIAPIPTVLGTDTDAARQFYRTSVSQIRMPPLPPQSKIAIGATAASQALAIPTPAAPVIPVAVGDGLIHGDTIWEVDPAFVNWRDDFQFGGESTGIGATSNIGELTWDASSSGGATYSQLTRFNGAFPHLGQFQVLANGSPNDYFFMVSPCSETSVGYLYSAMALLEHPPWKLIWVFNLGGYTQTTGSENMNKTSFYIGLTCPADGAGGIWDIRSANGTNARPPYFIGARFDKDPTSPAIGDTTIKLEVVGNYNIGNARNNTQGTVVDTGVVPSVQGNWCALEVTCTEVGIVSMSLTDDNGTSLVPRTAPASFTCPQMVTTTGGGAGQPQLAFNVGNGWNEVTQTLLSSETTPNNTNFCWGCGTIITIAGLTSTLAVYNGTFEVLQGGNTSNLFWPGTETANGVANNGASVTAYPVLLPFALFGNDSESSPVVDRVFNCDFFSMIFNPGVGGGTGTPNPLKSRYW